MTKDQTTYAAQARQDAWMQPGFRPSLRARPSLLDLVRTRNNSISSSAPGSPISDSGAPRSRASSLVDVWGANSHWGGPYGSGRPAVERTASAGPDTPTADSTAGTGPQPAASRARAATTTAAPAVQRRQEQQPLAASALPLPNSPPPAPSSPPVLAIANDPEPSSAPPSPPQRSRSSSSAHSSATSSSSSHPPQSDSRPPRSSPTMAPKVTFPFLTLPSPPEPHHHTPLMRASC